MQRLGEPGQPMVAVDYAHTPDALDKALEALRPLTLQRGGSLWCVFGCGGDRDPAKRERMGAVAARAADHVVVTSDNPRSEDPHHIMRQVMAGLAGHPSVSQQADRALAIAQTVERAQAADVVLVAGKGHETYQEVAGVRRPFSDLAQVHLALQRWHAPTNAQGVAA
jgi:UDP-N-acetylmuramoyl-L-alanyl-D-glutamate--2,6-diaminopimelate ligase